MGDPCCRGLYSERRRGPQTFAGRASPRLRLEMQIRADERVTRACALLVCVLLVCKAVYSWDAPKRRRVGGEAGGGRWRAGDLGWARERGR